MSFQAMTWAAEQNIPAMQKIVLLMMANRSNHDTGLCCPSHDLLAKECGMSKRSLIEQIEKLEKLGVIEVIRSTNDKKMKSVNRYILKISVKPSNLGSAPRSLGGSAGDALGSAGDALGSAPRSLGGSAPRAHKPVNIEPVIEPVKEPIKDTVSLLLSDFGIEGDLAKDFITHRKHCGKNSKGSPITRTAMSGFQREADKAGISILDAVRISIERNWVGFNADWIKPDIRGKPNSTHNEFNDMSSKLARNIRVSQKWLEESENDK